MEFRRIRVAAASIVGYGLLIGLTALPAAAAGGCSLAAPYALHVGDPLDVNGNGFPASSTIDVSLKLDGGTPDEFTVDSNASGAIVISLTPEAADAGHTTIEASAGSACTATAEFTVVAAGTALPVKPTPTPEAGSGADTSGSGTAPRTDVSLASARGLNALPPTALAIGFVSLLIGISGLIATRPARGR